MEGFTKENSSSPAGLVLDGNVAAVSWLQWQDQFRPDVKQDFCLIGRSQ